MPRAREQAATQEHQLSTNPFHPRRAGKFGGGHVNFSWGGSCDPEIDGRGARKRGCRSVRGRHLFEPRLGVNVDRYRPTGRNWSFNVTEFDGERPAREVVRGVTSDMAESICNLLNDERVRWREEWVGQLSVRSLN